MWTLGEAISLNALALPPLPSPKPMAHKQGDYVRIIDGPFKGIEGRVTKITGQKRVIVELPGLCSVATAYIPKVFLLQLEHTE